MKKKLVAMFRTPGFDPGAWIRYRKGRKWVRKDFHEFRAQLQDDPDFPMGRFYPVFTDKEVESGTASGHYFHQDLLVASRIYAAHPVKHVDIGSRIDGFVAHVASFREIEAFDIRPLASATHRIRFIQADVMQLGSEWNAYTDSVSCLHAIEHFGLGRYNDPIDAYGHLKGLEAIYRLLKPGGKFYFSTPIGPQRVEFNAHRVFSLSYLLELFRGQYRVENFSFVDDEGKLHENVPLSEEAVGNNFGCHYGCGILELTKL